MRTSKHRLDEASSGRAAHATGGQSPTPNTRKGERAVIEPSTRRVYFGGNDRTMTGRIDVELRIEPRTSVSVEVRRDRGQLLLTVGGCRLYGSRDDMEVVQAALGHGLDEIEAGARQAVKQDAQQEAATLCPSCHTQHAPNEPHASYGSTAKREPAYEILRRTYLLSNNQPELIADSCALWIATGDVAAARALLTIFVLPNVAHEVIDALMRPNGNHGKIGTEEGSGE